MPKISVIIPVYNAEESLTKCLDSVINQTLKDIEIICIDDHSTDNSLLILEEYAKQDNRIVVIKQEVNQGQGIARNIGIDKAIGEYIGFVDPDDYIDIEMYEQMYNQAKDLNSEIVICNSIRNETWHKKNYKINYFIRAISKTENEKIKVEEYQNIDKEIVLSTLFIAPCHSCNKIYKNEFLKSCNIKFDIERIYEDVLFVAKAFINAENISYINSPFYFYNVSKKSTTRSINNRQIIFLDLIEKIKFYLKEQNLYEKLKLNLDYYTVMNIIWLWMLIDIKLHKEFYKQLKTKIDNDNLREIKKYLHIGKREKIFSVTREKKRKIINICGIKLKFKDYNIYERVVNSYISKFLRNQNKDKKDSYILFDCLNDNTVECIDAFSLFEYMKNRRMKAYYVLLKNTQLYEQLKQTQNLENIITIENSSFERPDDFIKAIYEPLLRAKAVITSFGDNTEKIEEFFRTNKNFKYIFIQHGPTFLKESVLEKKYLYPEKYDNILISSENEYKLFKKYKWKDKQLIKCGLPRWDLLSKNITNEKSILMMFTWRNISNLGFSNSLFKKNILKLLNNREFISYLTENNIKLYFAPHHSLKNLKDIDFNINNKNVEIIDTTKISEYIKKCSCLITDFSSVSFDFMFQDKPVICYLMDRGDSVLKKYERKDIERFDYKKYILPNVFYEENYVIKKIKDYVEHNFVLEPEIKAKYDSFFYTKENIREQLTNKIEELCRTEYVKK